MDLTDAMAITDTDLAQAWTAGDERGYEQIVTRYAPMVYHRCRRSLGDTDADDATQAVFLTLARKRDQAAASPVLGAWLMTVADNVVRNAWRDSERRRRAEHAQPPAPTSTDGHPMDDMQESFREHLDASLAELPAPERAAVTLHHLGGQSLAQVAQSTGAGVSTVKDRLKRGLERLRRALAARGVTLSAVAMLSGLAAECQAAVPESVMNHLRDLTPAGKGPGATPGPSPRAVRWSQSRMSTMSRYALAGSLLLLAGGAIAVGLRSAEPPPQPAVVTFADGDVDPERAQQWTTLRFSDGARLVRRLKTLPEMAMLPAEGMAKLDELAGLKEAVLILDSHSLMPDQDSAKLFRELNEMRRLSSREQLARFEMNMEEAMKDMKRPGSASAAEASLPDPSAGMPKILSGLHGWCEGTRPDAAIMNRLRGLLDGQSWSRSTGPGAWTVSGAGTASVMAQGPRLVVGHPDDPALATIRRHATTAGSQAADMEFIGLLDPGILGRPWITTATASLTVTAEGLRFSCAAPWGTDAQRQDGLRISHLSKDAFARVPADAILAAGLALKPGEMESSIFWKSMLVGMTLPLRLQADADPAKANRLRLIDAFTGLLGSMDGSLLVWVQPGAPLPEVTCEADLPKTSFDRFAEVISTIGETPRSSDGGLTLLLGMVMVDIGWKDGRMICTTRPGGIGDLDHSGGFTRQPEIATAFAAMPDRTPVGCVLLRPAALIDYAAPYAAMAGPEWQTRLTDYRQRLTQSDAYGFFTVSSDKAGLHAKAAGLLSVIAGAAMAGQAASGMLQRSSN